MTYLVSLLFVFSLFQLFGVLRSLSEKVYVSSESFGHPIWRVGGTIENDLVWRAVIALFLRNALCLCDCLLEFTWERLDYARLGACRNTNSVV